jgi:hypothetical protein
MTAAKLTQCLCSSFDFGTFGEDGSAESYSDYNTGCTQTTTRVFAQGHDAKLVGFLVRAELAGEEISTSGGGMRMTYDGAVKAARTVSEALAAKAQAQLDAAKARLAKKAEVAARKAASRSAKKAVKVTETPKDRTATVKVGRWTYEAKIDGATGYALIAKKTGPVSIPPTKYTEV